MSVYESQRRGPRRAAVVTSISSVSPRVGEAGGGTPVTITGFRLSGVTGVTFGDEAATSVVPAATQVTCVTPAHDAGAVDVVVQGSYYGEAALTNGFEYDGEATTNEPGDVLPFYEYSPLTHGTDLTAPHGTSTSKIFNPNARFLERISVLDDAGTPSGKALDQRWDVGDDMVGAGRCNWGTMKSHVPDNALYPGWGGLALGALSKLYCRVWYKIPSGWQYHSGNGKFIGFGIDQGGSGLDCYLDHRSVAERHAFRFQLPTLFAANGVYVSDAGDMGHPVEDVWYDVEILLVAQSAPGVADGEFHVWRNGSKATNYYILGSGGSYDGTGLAFVSASGTGVGWDAIQNFPYYWGGTGQTKTQEDHLGIGMLYLSGKR